MLKGLSLKPSHKLLKRGMRHARGGVKHEKSSLHILQTLVKGTGLNASLGRVNHVCVGINM